MLVFVAQLGGRICYLVGLINLNPLSILPPRPACVYSVRILVLDRFLICSQTEFEKLGQQKQCITSTQLGRCAEIVSVFVVPKGWKSHVLLIWGGLISDYIGFGWLRMVLMTLHAVSLMEI